MKSTTEPCNAGGWHLTGTGTSRVDECVDHSSTLLPGELLSFGVETSLPGLADWCPLRRKARPV